VGQFGRSTLDIVSDSNLLSYAISLLSARGKAIEESVDLAHEIYNRIFRKVPERVNGG
jgi:ABC-type arginine transport system permease subunit